MIPDHSLRSPSDFDEEFANDLIGARVLVGVTYRDPNEPDDRIEQFVGEVVGASESAGIIIRLVSGAERALPPVTSLFERAPPGEYRLRSTGEVVVNPDYIATWTVYAGRKAIPQ